MNIHSYLGRFRRWAKSAPKARKARHARPHLGLENLEDRLVLSTVNIAKGVLTYQAAAGEVNSLEISLDQTTNTFTFEETGGVAIVQDGNFYSKVTADGSLVDSIQVNLDDKNDILKVLSTNKPINVAGGDGNDIVRIGDDSATGQGMENVTESVVFDGGAQHANGKDQLVFADRNAAVVGGQTLDYFVDGDAVTRQRLNSIKQSLGFVRHRGTNVEEVDLDASDQSDSIGVSSTLAGTSVVIHADDGNDTVSVGNMDLLAGGLTIEGKNGTDTLTIDDRLAPSNRNYVINTDTVSQGAATITLDTLEGLTLDAANKVNTIDVQSTNALMPLTLKGGIGRDTVTINDTALTGIQTYNFNAGSLERWTSIILFAFPTADVNYSGVEKLIIDAGPSNDTFNMTDTNQPALTINGGGGINEINYSAFTTNVIVNLARGEATNVSNLSNVENATGGDGDDTLVGDANANVFKGLGGRDLLIGGEGADLLDGGAGQDLMIDGTTDFDITPTALATISSTWAGTGKTQDRVNTLKTGVSGVALSDNGTVHDDAARDQLFSDDDGTIGAPNTADWFWADSTQDDFTLLTGDIFK